MHPASTGSILICSAPVSAAEEFREPLVRVGFDVHFHHLNAPEMNGALDYRLLLVDGTNEPDLAVQWCKRFRDQLDELYTPIMMLTENGAGDARLAGFQNGVDVHLVRPFTPAELAAQVQALLRIKSKHDYLLDKTAEVDRINKRLQAAYKQIDQELEIAQRIQTSFLPQDLPKLPQIKFAVQYRPCNHVGGDFYDVFRLDEHHCGFYLADAMGHGVPASLLTIFVKTSVCAKEIQGKSYRLISPDNVLGNLNRNLIDQALSDNPFITMVYFLFNFNDGTIQFSRAGHPYPIYIPKNGEPEFWKMDGSLLGVFDIKYAIQSHRMQPGDKLLVYTDGTDAASFQKFPVGTASLMEAVKHYRKLSIGELVEQLGQELFQQTKQSDDLTIFGVEMLTA